MIAQPTRVNMPYYRLLFFFSAGFGGLIKLFGSRLVFGSRPVFDLKTEMKVMFDEDNMLPVSTNAGLFIVVMSAFTQYEKVVHVSIFDCITYRHILTLVLF